MAYPEFDSASAARLGKYEWKYDDIRWWQVVILFFVFPTPALNISSPKLDLNPLCQRWPHRLGQRRKEVFLTKANGGNFWEEMSRAGVGKKNENLLSSNVIVFQYIVSNTGSWSWIQDIRDIKKIQTSKISKWRQVLGGNVQRWRQKKQRKDRILAHY